MTTDERVERVIKEAKYILETKDTVRGAAEVFGISKSAIHYHLTVILGRIDRALFVDVSRILEFNKNERYKRGGNANAARLRMKET